MFFRFGVTTSNRVDEKWFKQRQKIAGVTAEDIANRVGRARSNVSHIYSGKQKMSMDWAKAFSEVLGVPLATIIEKAGLTDKGTAQTFSPGFSESDAAAWIPEGGSGDAGKRIAAALGGDRPGIDIWQVKSPAMALQGYLPGDLMLVDTHAAERTKPGDTVIAQVYDNAQGTASTILRRYAPPVLVAASSDPDDQKVHVVDGSNVVVRGKVIASWRA